MEQLEGLNQFIRLHEKEIEKRFCKLNHTPDHPPYASMIEKAISELKEQGGSSEEAISKFIQTEYDDLPIAHSSYLSHHLQKLVTDEDIIRTSSNCYLLSFEIDISEGQKQFRNFRQSRLKGKVKKGVKSHQNRIIDVRKESNQVCGKISKQEHNEEGNAIVIEEEHSDVGEERPYKVSHQARRNNQVIETELLVVREDVVTEELHHKEQNNSEKPDEINEICNQESESREEEVHLADIDIETMVEQVNLHGPCQVLGQTIEGAAAEQRQEEMNHQERIVDEVTETEFQEAGEDVLTEEPHCKEQNSEKPEERNETQDQDSEAREEQVQLTDIQVEKMVRQIKPQGQGLKVCNKEKKLQEQQIEACCQIIDLSNMLLHFVNKEKEDKTSESSQSITLSCREDLFGSSNLTKEELMELLKKTNNIEGKLIDIICSLNMDVVECDNSRPTTEMEQEKLLEDCLQQTKKPCLKGSESLVVPDYQLQQQEICGHLEVLESQPESTLASHNVTTDLREFEQNCEIEHPIHKRPSEVEITTLEGLYREQNKLARLQEGFKLQSKSMPISLDASSNLLHDENETSQVDVERIELVLEDSPPTEPNIIFTREEAISRPETETSFVDVRFMDSEKLQNTKHCGPEKLPESQLNKKHDHQADLTTSDTSQVDVERIELAVEDSPTTEPYINFIREEAISRPETETSFIDCQYTGSEKLQNTKHCGPEKLPESQLNKKYDHQADLTTSDTSLNLDLQFPVPERPPQLTVQDEELSTDHQQQTTFSGVANRPGYKEQQPENVFEKRPTELTTAQHSFQTQQQMQGQKLQDQLLPLCQMPSKPRLTTAISIVKQRRRIKRMPDPQQLGKLRRRGPRPSNYEPVLTTVEVDNDMTLASLKAELNKKSECSNRRRLQEQGSQAGVEISQSTKQEPLIRKRKLKHSHKAAVDIPQPTEAAVNIPQPTEAAVNIPQPTEAAVNIPQPTEAAVIISQPTEAAVHVSQPTEAAVDILQPTEQQVRHHGQGKRLKSKPTTTSDDLIITLKKQRESRPQGRHGSLSESVGGKPMEESLHIGNKQSEEVEPHFRHQGRPTEVKLDVDNSHQHHVQQQPPCRTRGRPPKKKTNADSTMKGSLFSDPQNHEEKQGKPARGRPPKRKTNADSTTKNSLSSDHQNHEEQQKPAQGRP